MLCIYSDSHKYLMCKHLKESFDHKKELIGSLKCECLQMFNFMLHSYLADLSAL